ncbi:MAG: hydrogenase 4 membrane subunit [Coriobacteriales bacterium]|jgi:hydrogenase-4 component E|nr:hydrogenase 4 membrane subunit [Coriobacteriales bacterium]
MDGYALINILGGLLIITSLMVVLTKTIKRAAYIYGAQALVLVAIFITLGVVTDSSELFKWAGTALLTKVILIPAVVLFGLKKLGGSTVDTTPPRSSIWMIVLVAAEVILSFLAVGGVELPTALEVKPALAISLAHFFIGLTCIISQRNIVKQIFGFCLMENGSHVTLALLAPDAPSLLEIGIATDAIFVVAVMVFFAVRIYKSINTLDTNEIMNLKG